MYSEHTRLWKELITIKYGKFTTNASPFRKGISSLYNFLQIECKKLIGDGQSTNFWNDIGISNVP